MYCLLVDERLSSVALSNTLIFHIFSYKGSLFLNYTNRLQTILILEHSKFEVVKKIIQISEIISC